MIEKDHFEKLNAVKGDKKHGLCIRIIKKTL